MAITTVPVLTLDCVAWDTVALRAGSAQLFVDDADRTEPTQSATDTTERELVQFLMSNADTRALLLRVLDLDVSCSWFAEVTHPFVDTAAGTPGDIDLMLIPRSKPQHAVGAEVKWLKVRPEDVERQKLTKLRAAVRGVEQANRLRSVGFSRTVLILVAVVDDRSNLEYNFFFRGAKPASLKRFLEFTNDAPLDSEVGVLYVEVAQPIEKQPLEAAMVCAGLLKRPVWREQHSDVTARVAAFSRVAAR